MKMMLTITVGGGLNQENWHGAHETQNWKPIRHKYGQQAARNTNKRTLSEGNENTNFHFVFEIGWLVGWVRVPFDRSGMSSSPWSCSSRAIIYSPSSSSSSFQSLSAMLILHLNITLRMFLDFFENFVNKGTCLGGHWESTIELVLSWPLSVNLPVSVNLRSCPIIPRSPLWGSNRRQCSPNCLFLPHSHSLPQGWTRPRTLTIVGCRTIHRGGLEGVPFLSNSMATMTMMWKEEVAVESSVRMRGRNTGGGFWHLKQQEEGGRGGGGYKLLGWERRMGQIKQSKMDFTN